MPEYTGALRKMHVQLPEQPDASVQYSLALDSEAVPLNEALGQPISLSYAGQINCVHCNRKTKKALARVIVTPVLENSPAVTSVLSAQKSVITIWVPVESQSGAKNFVCRITMFILPIHRA